MLTINCRTIVRKDQEATNGVVHLIDNLLDPAAVMNREVSEIVSSVSDSGSSQSKADNNLLWKIKKKNEKKSIIRVL